MKKFLYVVMLAMLLVSVLGFSAKTTSAAGLIEFVDARLVSGKGVVYIFAAEGLRNKDVRGAEIWAGSNLYDLGCTVKKQAGLIICVVGGDITPFAGQTAVIFLGGQIFYVSVPGRAAGDGSLLCPEGTIPGADVTFFTSNETLETYFVPGSSISAVQNEAQSYLGDYLIRIEDIGSLYCGEQSN